MRFSVASLLIWGCGFASCEKRQTGRWRPGWRYQEGPGRGFLFLLSTMCQDSVDDVLVFDATVRRSDDDFSGPTAAITNFNIDADGRPIDTRLSRWAQDIATCRSAGERLVSPGEISMSSIFVTFL
jgi:hypothetical protein